MVKKANSILSFENIILHRCHVKIKNVENSVNLTFIEEKTIAALALAAHLQTE